MKVFGYLRGEEIRQEWKNIFELQSQCCPDTDSEDTRIFRQVLLRMARDYLCRLFQSSSCIAGAYYFSEGNYRNGIISLGIGATAVISGRRFDRKRKELLTEFEQRASEGRQ